MMNCKRAKLSIALAVGNDLDDAADGELQQHLAGCTSCRMHQRELENSLGALQTGPEEDVFAAQDSVWPAVLGRLPSTREQRFNGWIPAAALAAACLMMISIINEPPRYGSADAEPYGVQALGTANQPHVLPAGWPDSRQQRGRLGLSSVLGPDGTEIPPERIQWFYNWETGEIFYRIVPSYNR